MTIRTTLNVAGVNLTPETVSSPYDCYCPHAGSPNAQGFNFPLASCEIKQRTKGLHRTCYPYCKAKNPPAHIKPPTDEQRKLQTELTTPKGKVGLLKRATSIALAHKLREAALTGMTRAEIAEKYDISKTTVTRYINHIGKVKFASDGNITKAKAWLAMRQRGILTKDIAKSYDVSTSTVRRIIRMYKETMEENNG